MIEPRSRIIDNTITFWKKRNGITVSSEEARQAIENVDSFFQILNEWAHAEHLKEGRSDNSPPNTKKCERDEGEPLVQQLEMSFAIIGGSGE